MPLRSVEIKARRSDDDAAAATLRRWNARFVGEDHQIDTYFICPNGRLKLREGTIERNLIHYHRPDQPGPKRSDVTLFPVTESGALKSILSQAFGVRTVVEKWRQVFFLDNVKFHLDRVAGLGSFLEIEALDTDGLRTDGELHQQCAAYCAGLGVGPEDLITGSYAEMLLALDGTVDSTDL